MFNPFLLACIYSCTNIDVSNIWTFILSFPQRIVVIEMHQNNWKILFLFVGNSPARLDEFVRQECEAEEEIRSIEQSDQFYDEKKVNDCIQLKQGFKQSPSIVKDTVDDKNTPFSIDNKNED